MPSDSGTRMLPVAVLETLAGDAESSLSKKNGGDAWARILLLLSFHACLLSGTLLPAPTWGGEVEVVRVSSQCTAKRICRFQVTLRHEDTGWKHFANRYEIIAPDGKILATRVLRHPHVDEQPFTRELRSVSIPAGVERVTVRGHDLVHGYGGRKEPALLRIPPPLEPPTASDKPDT